MIQQVSGVSNQKGCVITVHGVGVTKAGETLTGIETHFSKSCSTYYKSFDLIAGGIRFPACHSPEPKAPDLLEINWADVQRPSKSWISAFSHLAKILIGMLHLADHWVDRGNKGSWLISVYRVLFELTTIWTIPFVTYEMALVSVAKSNTWIVVVAGTGLVVAITLHVRKWSKSLLFGGILFSLVYLVIGLLVCESNTGFSEWLTNYTANNYVNRHLFFPFFVAALFIFIMFPRGSKKGTLEQRLARFGMAYMPILGVSIVGACLWVLVIPLVSGSEAFDSWTGIHDRVLKAKNYDLKAAEWFHFGVITVFGCIALISAVIYMVRRINGSSCAGVGVRNTLPVLVGFIPIGLIVVCLAMYTTLPSKFLSEDKLSVYEIYKISALRVLPFLPWLLTPMVIVLDVVGDIVFLALPEGDCLSIRREVSDRIHSVLDHVSSNYDGIIIILAHSLGSVIALQELSKRKDSDRFQFITVGSPISSIHKRFLGWSPTIEEGYEGLPKRWHNINRYGDYVGSKIDELDEGSNQCLGKRGFGKYWDNYGGHVKYWDDPVVLRSLTKFLT